MENEIVTCKCTQNCYESVSGNGIIIVERSGAVKSLYPAEMAEVCYQLCKTLGRQIWTLLPVTDEMRRPEERAGRDAK